MGTLALPYCSISARSFAERTNPSARRSYVLSPSDRSRHIRHPASRPPEPDEAERSSLSLIASPHWDLGDVSLLTPQHPESSSAGVARCHLRRGPAPRRDLKGRSIAHE